MKKLSILATLTTAFVASSVFAETANTEQAQQPAQEAQSTLHLGVYNVSGKAPVALDKLEVSRSSKKQQLCWVAQGVFTPKVQTVEIFTSPAKASFNIASDIGMATSSADKKTHTVTSTRDSFNEGKIVSNCWSFDQKDPRGKYTLFVKIGDMEYGPLSFTVVK